MSGHIKKVHYDRGRTKDRQHSHRSRRDSGVSSGSASDRASLGPIPDKPFTSQQRDDQRQILGAVQEALDAANEKIRQLEAANAKLNTALKESNQENRLLKRKRAELHNELDDAIADLESERRTSRRARDGSPSGNREGSPSVPSRRTVRARQERRSGILPESRDEKRPPAKSIDLAVISQPTRFFQVGRVFKTLWTEPAGETATDTDKEYYRPVGYGQLSFTKMRRFVVIRKRLHSCLCLAISTYGGQGSTKKDSRSEDHAVVYASKDPPPLTALDEQFTKEPIPVILEENSESIDPKSVIDFGRVYTVEHNVKVSNVGRVAKSDKKRLEQYFIDTIGMTPDLEDEGYGGDIPIARPDYWSDRQQAGSESRASSSGILPASRAFSTPNPMANPFTPSISSLKTNPSPNPFAPPVSSRINFFPKPSPMYYQSQLPGYRGEYGSTMSTYPLPNNYYMPPRPPDGASKYPPNDGQYHSYPI